MGVNKYEHYQYLLGLIGYPLSHSFSKKYFSEKFEQEKIEGYYYELFSIPAIEDLAEVLEQYQNLLGLNVTIPYKQAVIPFMSELKGAAKDIQAVNTIKVGTNGLVGYNTDVYGFEVSLKEQLQKHQLMPTKALVLGTGGASKAIHYVLDKLDIAATAVSRRPAAGLYSYQELTEEILEEHELIVNTTPLGTYPEPDRCPDLPYEALGSRHMLYDLVYNPSESLFMKKGTRQGAHATNGLRMLVLQAEKAWEIWNSDDES